ncbi:hypothetical protein J6590_016341 [Homalodisca vitripennis]|nr:hypothetical protein J6590_016341 [Homalodisca vitripennis]
MAAAVPRASEQVTIRKDVTCCSFRLPIPDCPICGEDEAGPPFACHLTMFANPSVPVFPVYRDFDGWSLSGANSSAFIPHLANRATQAEETMRSNRYLLCGYGYESPQLMAPGSGSAAVHRQGNDLCWTHNNSRLAPPQLCSRTKVARNATSAGDMVLLPHLRTRFRD